MKLSLYCIGRARGALQTAIEDYEARITRYYRWDAIELKETPFRGQPIPQLLDDEGARILARVSGQNHLIALDRTGALWSSEELAQHLTKSALAGIPSLAFVIGGAYGLAPAIIERADHILSLSRMTLPHEMARLVLSEQIYRACSIARGEPYHK